MVVIDIGLNTIRDIFTNNIMAGQCGTAGTAASTTDTGLVAPIGATLKLFIQTTKTDKQLNLTYDQDFTIATGTTFREFGVLLGTVFGTAYGTAISRMVFSDVTKLVDEEFNFNTAYFFRTD